VLRAVTLVNVLLARRRRRYRLFFRSGRRRVFAFEGVSSVVLRAMTLVSVLLARRRRRYRLP
jgi:hypothetical protein